MAQQQLEVRSEFGGISFYINGSLQFSTVDEHVYHETLVVPAASLVDFRCGGKWNALILGGGDGLASRELLRCAACSKIDLVDHDPQVLQLAQTQFAPFNCNAFSDARMHVHCRDALQFLQETTSTYNLIIADFTFPGTLDGCRLFTTTFFKMVASSLAPGGVVALNTCSPNRHPYAFWSIEKTLSAAGLNPKPLRVAIPSFSASGYGEWGFFMASPIPISAEELSNLTMPPLCRHISPVSLNRSLYFDLKSIAPLRNAVSTLQEPADLMVMLGLSNACSAPEVMFSLAGPGLLLPLAGYGSQWVNYGLKMLRNLDLEAFLSEVEARISHLSSKVRERFIRFKEQLRAYIRGDLLSLERAEEMVAAFLFLLVLINVAYPDNAYAKGSHGGGDSDISLFADVAADPFHKDCYQQQIMTNIVGPTGLVVPMPHARYQELRGSDVDEPLIFALSDRLYLGESGGVFMMVPGTSVTYRVNATILELYDNSANTPLLSFNPDPWLMTQARESIKKQLQALDKTLEHMRRWQSWIEPLTPINSAANRQKTEIANLQRIRSALAKADSSSTEIQGGPEDFTLIRIVPGVYRGTDGAILLDTTGGWFEYVFEGETKRSVYPTLASGPVLDTFIAAATGKVMAPSPSVIPASTGF